MVDQLNPKSKDNIMRLQQESARVPSGRKSARVQRIELEDRIRILKMQVNELTEQLQRYSEDLKIKDDTIKFLQVDKERIVKITESNDREIISEEIAKLRHQLRIKDDEVKKEHEEVHCKLHCYITYILSMYILNYMQILLCKFSYVNSHNLYHRSHDK